MIVLRRSGQPGRHAAGPRPLVARARAPVNRTMAETERTDAEDPLMIIYTSGTTGKPKGAVHTHCGFPVKAAQDMAFGTDVHPGETHLLGHRHGLDDGPVAGLRHAAARRDDAALRRRARLSRPRPPVGSGRAPRRHRAGHLARRSSARCPHGDEPVRKHDLSSLRNFASTGEPWNPAPWLWLFDSVGKRKLPIINYSGGTEISGGIVMGNVAPAAQAVRVLRRRCPAWPPTWSTSRASPCATRSASWSSAQPGSA